MYHVFKEDDFTELEKLLEQYSAEGWDLVSVCPNEYMNNVRGSIMVTLQREKRYQEGNKVQIILCFQGFYLWVALYTLSLNQIR